MSTDTVTSAVARRDDSPRGVIEQYRADFATVLPSHIKPETWVRVAQGALKRTPGLEEAARNNIGAFLAVLLESARLGLEPGTEQYYLVPRKNKRTNRKEVSGVRGYQGEIELMYRAGAISSVIVEVVRDRDRFTYTPGRDERPVHEIDWDAEDRGELRLVYAYAVMKDGATSKVVVLNRRHIEAAKQSSDSADSAYSPWQRHEEAMWLKTAAHRLAKWVPTSAEYMREQLRAVRDVQAEQPPRPTPVADQPVDVSGLPEVDDPDVVDAELVEPEFDDEYQEDTQ